MKPLISILLCTAFLFQPLSKLLILLNYELNQTTITANFCVNKNKPSMHCNGKCHLKKQLEKEDKKQQSIPSSLKEKSEIQFYSSPSICTLNISSVDILSHFTYLALYPDSPPHAIFHPPTLS